MIDVVIAEDHTLVRESVARLLAGQPDLRVVAEAGRGDVAIGLILRHRPDIALLDISMPGADGLAVGVELRRRGCPVPIVYLTMHKDPATVRAARQVGARGYVLKDDAPEELLRSLRTVAGGGRHFSAAVAEAGGSGFLRLVTAASADELEATVVQAVAGGGVLASPVECNAALAEIRRRRASQRQEQEPFRRLSPREAEVLSGLLEGMSADAIATCQFVSVATVRTQIRSILRKLGVNSQLAAVAAARRAGWRPQQGHPQASG